MKLAYRFLDWGIEREAKKYFDLDKSQKKVVQERVKKYMKWHRVEMLPQYSRYFKSIEFLVTENSLSEELYKEKSRDFQKLMQETFKPMVPGSGTLLKSLDKKQIEHFYEKVKKRNRKIAEKNSGTEQERLERNYEKNLKMLKDWTGVVTEEQKKILRGLKKEDLFPHNAWMPYRLETQKRFLGLLKGESSAVEIESFISRWLVQAPEEYKQDYLTAQKVFTEKTAATIVLIVKSLTSKQRQAFAKKISKFARDFDTLSR